MEHIHWLYGVVTLGLFIWSMRTRDERSNLLREVAYLTSKVGYLDQALSLSQGEERGLAQELRQARWDIEALESNLQDLEPLRLAEVERLRLAHEREQALEDYAQAHELDEPLYLDGDILHRTSNGWVLDRDMG